MSKLFKMLQLTKQNPLQIDIIKLAPDTIFDIAGHCILKKNESIALSSTEFKLLFLLATNQNSSFTAEDLMDHIDLSGLSSLYVHIQNLRKKVENNPSNPSILINNRGRGYKIQIV